MEKAVVQFGIDPLIAGEYTPYELLLIGKQVQEKSYREFENALTVAWHTEAFARQRKLPKLEKILKDVRKPSKKTNSRSDAIWNIISTAFDIIYNAVVSFLGYVQPIWENIKQLFASLWDTMVALYETLKPVFDLLGGIIMTLYGVVTSVVSGIISALGPFVQAVIDVAQAILEVIQLVCAVLRGDWSEAWEHMKNVASNLWDAIKKIFLGIWEFIQGFCEGIKNFFGNLGDTIVAIFKSAWDGISGFFVNLWEGIKSACSWIWDTITGLFSKIGDFFSDLFKDAFNWGKNLIQNIGDGIKKAWNWVVDGVKGVGQSIADFLGFGSPTKKGPGHTADEWIADTAKNYASTGTIKTKFDSVDTSLQNVGKLKIGSTWYQARSTTSTSDTGQSGYITFIL